MWLTMFRCQLLWCGWDQRKGAASILYHFISFVRKLYTSLKAIYMTFPTVVWFMFQQIAHQDIAFTQRLLGNTKERKLGCSLWFISIAFYMEMFYCNFFFWILRICSFLNTFVILFLRTVTAVGYLLKYVKFE